MELSSGSSSSKSVGEKDRGEEKDLDAASGGESRRLKMRALKSVMQSEAARSPKLVCSDMVDIPVLTTTEVTSPMKEVPVSVLRGGVFPPITRCSSDLLGGRDGRYSCNSGEISRSLKVDNDMAKEHGSGSRTNTVKLGGCQLLEETAAPPAHVFDLNAVDVASAAEHNQFHPYKMLEQVTSAESECGSTTSPLGESGPMKRWNDLKQNSFISNSYGGIPIPKAPQRKYQTKKRKEAELRKNTELAKKEQLSRFSRTAAPTGLLSGLNPGIINHVRNSKQVRYIIESIVKSAKLDELCNQSDMEGKEANNTNSDPWGRHHSDAYNPSLSHITLKSDCIDESSGGQSSEEKTSYDGNKSSCFTSECDGDTLSLKLSSSGVNIVDNESCRKNDEFSASPETINALSLRGASIASQWLELLHQDLRGRYAALKRSRKRVRNVIQAELPHLYNVSNCEKLQHMSQSSGINGSIEAHAARWKSIFSQMEKTLNEEAKHLESCLLQVREMQSHCDMGLKYANATNASVSGSSSLSSQKDARTVEREYAIMAAAASIHSTCEFAMSAENVSCF